MEQNSEENSTSNEKVYLPFKAQMPPLRAYFKDFLSRIDFAKQLASSGLRAQHSNTVAGQLWLVINPLLLALTYFFLVMVVSKGANRGTEYFAHLLAGIFMFYFVSNSLVGGASSIVNVGSLISNKAFPRLLLPFSSIIMAARRFLPTMIVYVCFHLLFRLPISVKQFALLPVFFLFLTFSFGLAAFFATLQIYFRDTRTILPYVMRIWLYLTPVLYFSKQISENLSVISKLNPLYDLFVLWGEILIKGVIPGPQIWIGAVLWTSIIFIGGISFFLSREREFAIRV